MKSKIIICLLFYSLLFFSSTVRSFLFAPFLSGIILFYLIPRVKFDLTKSVLILLMLSLFIETGVRGFNVIVVESSWIFNLLGYKFYFGISLKLIFGLLLLLLALKERWIEKKKWLEKLNSIELVSLFTFIQLTIVSVFLNDSWSIGMYGLIRIFLGVWLFLLGRKYLHDLELLSWFKWIIVSSLMFEGVVSGLQWMKGGVLGKHIESTAKTVPFGRVTYESDLLYRTVGTTGHPTFFASLLSVLIPVVFGLWIIKITKTKKIKVDFELIILSLSLILGILGVLTSFSRSSWVVVVLMIGVMGWLGLRGLDWKLLVRKSWWLVGSGVALFLWLSGEIVLRLSSFKLIFSLGTGKDRWLLMKEAGVMIKNYPAWGVGLNNFTGVLAQSDLTGLASRLLFPVHNTFVLFASEIGLLATVSFIVFIGLVLVKSFQQSFKNIFMMGVWLSCVSYIFNSQFHALFSQDPTFDYFMLMLGLLSSRSKA